MTEDNKVFAAMTPHVLAAIMQELGFRAELDLSDPKLLNIESYSDGWLFLVFLYGQDQPGGGLFHAQLYSMQPEARITPSFCNAWNARYNFGTMYVQEDGTPTIRMEILLQFITKGYLRHCFGLWEAVLRRFLISVRPQSQGSERLTAEVPRTDSIDGPVRLPANDISRGDLSTIERYLSSIADNTRTMASGNPGSDLRAIVNRLETANGLLGTIASNTRK